MRLLAFLLCLSSTASARHADYPFELGGFAGANLYQADGSLITPEGSIAFGARLGYGVTPLLTLEGEATIVPTQAASTGVLQLGLDAHAVLNLPLRSLAKRSLVPFLIAGGGFTETSYASSMVDTANNQVNLPLSRGQLEPIVDGGIGVKFFPITGMGLRLDVRAAWGPSRADGFAAPRVMVYFGGYARLGSAEDRSVPVTNPGATDPDGDGIYGDADKCPNEPEDKDGFEDADGCPDSDNDQDGIPDFADECPNLPGTEENGGCPDTDPDNDGIAGAADKCPGDPEDKDGFQDADGCPDPDNDQDGIADANDKCPNDAETANGYQDDDGCPDEPPAELTKLGPIDVTPAAIADAAKLLAKYPTSTFAVTAPTQARADAMKKLLVERGAPEAKLTALEDKAAKRMTLRLYAVPKPPIPGPTPTPTSQPAAPASEPASAPTALP